MTRAALGLCLACSAGPVLAAQAPTWVVAPRYSSATSFTLFAARIASRWLVAEELSVALHSDEWALAVGAGPRFQIPHADILTIAGPLVVKGGVWYAAVFVAPALHLGRLANTGTLELFFPVTPGEHFVYEFSHVRVLGAVTAWAQAGVFYHMVKSAGDRAEEEIGPSLRLRVSPRLKVTADGAWGLHATPSEVVLTLQWET